MYIVQEAYDDNEADILDISTYSKRHLSEKELIEFGKIHDVIGLYVYGRKIHSLTGNSISQFTSDTEMYEYINYNNITNYKTFFINNYFWVISRKDYKIHVDYYVVYYTGDIIHYLCQKGTSIYRQAALAFDKLTAKQKAAIMRRNSKTGKYWTTLRIPNR